MIYKIVVRKEVHEDIFELADYILRFSFSVEIARNIKNNLYEKMSSLNFFPQKFQKVLWDYRVALVKKTYRIFYRIEEETKTVVIVRVIRTDQNIDNIF